jgi:hypothetical protein
MSVVAFAGFVASAAFSDDLAPVYQADPQTRLGRPKVIIAPEYPPAALSEHRTGSVEVRGRIDPYHALVDPEYRAENPDSEVFVAAVRAVVPRWEFYPVTRSDCFPAADVPVAFRVLFDLEAGNPKIDVEVLAAGPKRPAIPVVARVKLTYPRDALRVGIEAVVYARLVVNPDGSVAEVTTDSYPKRVNNENRSFENEVERNLGRWKFAALPPGGDQQRRIVCEDVLFNIRD